MSGHSKWHNIRLRKGRQDAERGKIFTRLAREIIIAAKEGGGNPDANTRLRLAIEKARENSMPQESIRRAIMRGTGELEGVSYEEMTYEGYGPGGVAVLVQAMTDNRNRTVAELRNIFSKAGGNLGESGCVAWLFNTKGLVSVPKDAAAEDDVLFVVLDLGAEDVRAEESTWDIICPPEALAAVREGLERAGIPIQAAEVTQLPSTTVNLAGKEAQQMLRLMEQLEDHDDVQNIYANFDIEESVLAAYG
ncbi:MAG: YebC/PmpR family DNA-binding transcriptional regulator [Armatimonadetes bacterium]|nr:YebC/PmpR family DNA-binding transcriptional regulator [Armatimonadota bacterium]